MPVSLGTLTITAMYLGTTAISGGYLGTTQVFGGSAFSPSSLFAASEPGVWYDPSDLATLFTDTAGTTPVTTPGQTVARMNDKSGRGNNATQSTTASRPTYGVVPLGGRRNLLTWSEGIGNAAWSKTSTTVTDNAGSAPNGTTTADALIEAATASTHTTQQDVSATSGLTYTASVYLKANGRGFADLSLRNLFSANIVSRFTLSGSGSVVTREGSPAAQTIESVGSGWYRCAVSGTTTSSGTLRAQIFIAPDATNSAFYTGDGTSGILIWGAQLETGSTATPYQRVTTAFDVTEAGVQSLAYLSFDGVDDFMVTPTITPGVDKAQVFAGVRKLSDAAYNSIVETSADPAANNGTIAVGASALLGGDRQTWVYQARGTANNFGGARVFAAPSTIVQTLLTDLAETAKEAEIVGRVNGVQQSLVFTSGTSIGTGNYLAYPLYLGRRGGTTLPFNGNVFSLLVRFGANLTTPQITDTETWVNGKTGAY